MRQKAVKAMRESIETKGFDITNTKGRLCYRVLKRTYTNNKGKDKWLNQI